ALRTRDTLNKDRMLTELAKQKGRPISPEEYKAIMEHNTPFDPLYTPEKEYAKYYMKFLESSPELQAQFQQATPEEQEEAKRITAISQNFISRITFLRKLQEDADAAYKNQSWLGWGVDMAKSMVPGHDDYYLRGTVPGTGVFNGPI